MCEVCGKGYPKGPTEDSAALASGAARACEISHTNYTVNPMWEIGDDMPIAIEVYRNVAGKVVRKMTYSAREETPVAGTN